MDYVFSEMELRTREEVIQAAQKRMDYVFSEIKRRSSCERNLSLRSGGRANRQAVEKVDYQWSRRKLEFLERFMFAITVDVILKTGKTKLSNVMPGLRQSSPGKYVSMAKSLLTAIPEKRREEFEQIWNIMGELAEIRNREAHGLEEMKTYNNAVERVITQLRDATKAQFFDIDPPKDSPDYADYSYTYDYLLVDAPEDASEKLFPCTLFDSAGADQTCIPAAALRRRADPIEGELYLRVTKRTQDNRRGSKKVQSRQEEFYRLSPFIQIYVEEDGLTTTPVMYNETTRFFSEQMLMVYLYVTKEGAVDLTCSLPSLLPQIDQKDKRYSHLISSNSSNGRDNTHIEINLSRYPDFARLQERDYQYCKSICPKLEEAISFCQRKKDRSWGNYLIVKGEGGVGKTALVFYLINKIIIGGQTTFNRIIFLTAKKYFRFTDRPVEDEAQTDEITPDIGDYHELLERLSWLLSDDGKAVRKKDDNEMEKDLLAQINDAKDPSGKKSWIPQTFLVIDDLDTFSPEDQEKTIAFLNRLNGKRMLAVITTRNEKTSGCSIDITRLDETGSMDFLRWCIEQRLPNQGDERCRMQNPQILYQWTEGRALYIKLWGNLIIQGLNPIIDFPGTVTSAWRMIYLHRNTLKQLSRDKQQLFQIICGFNSALCQSLDYTDERFDILYPVLLYLMPERETDTVNDCIACLNGLQLIESEVKGLGPEINSVRIGDYSYTDLLSQSQLAPLPEPVNALLENVRKAPGAWRSAARYIDQLINYLALRLSEDHKDFELGIARRMLEVRKYLNQNQLSLIKGLIDQYGSDAPHSHPVDSPPSEAPNKKTAFSASFESFAKAVEALYNDAHKLSDEEFDWRKDAIGREYQYLNQATQNEEDRDRLKKLRKKYSDLF